MKLEYFNLNPDKESLKQSYVQDIATLEIMSHDFIVSFEKPNFLIKMMNLATLRMLIFFMKIRNSGFPSKICIFHENSIISFVSRYLDVFKKLRHRVLLLQNRYF